MEKTITGVVALLVVLIAVVMLAAFVENGVWIIATVFAVVFILAVFFAGFYAGQASYRTGAKITLEAQRLNDNYDMVKMAGLTRVFTEVLKTARSGQNGSAAAEYPPLLGASAIDAETKYLATGFETEGEIN